MIIRRIPIPITFSVVVAATVFLIIFFGAWAVSADSGNPNRKLSFGIAGANPGLAANTGGVYQENSPARFGEDEISAGENASWWSSSLLKACPLH
ncbi:MAG: hypothetical protein AAB528_05400 [Chloroflexota bacterium]